MMVRSTQFSYSYYCRGIHTDACKAEACAARGCRVRPQSSSHRGWPQPEALHAVTLCCTQILFLSPPGVLKAQRRWFIRDYTRQGLTRISHTALLIVKDAAIFARRLSTHTAYHTFVAPDLLTQQQQQQNTAIVCACYNCYSHAR